MRRLDKMNENEMSVYTDEELKSIYNCLTRTKSGYMRIKKKTPVIPEKLAVEVTMSEYEKEFTALVKQVIDKV